MANQANVALLTEDPQLVPQVVTVLAGGGPTSQRPSNPATWFEYFDTDLNRSVVWNGLVWIVTSGGPTGPVGPTGPAGPAELSGPTSMRPSSPVDFQRYYDTDISCEIWWERGAWRTTAGTVGDYKVVTAANGAAAVANNPGWVLDSSGVKVGLQAMIFPPETQPLIITVSSGSGNFSPYDLTGDLNANGLAKASHVLLSMEAVIPAQGFRNQGQFEVFVFVASTSQPGGSTPGARAHAYATINDSDSSASDTSTAVLPITDGNNFYYSLLVTHTSNPVGRIWLTGFLFDPLTDPTTITSFGLRKT